MTDTAFTFDDFMLSPEFCAHETQAITGSLFEHKMEVPIIASPMETICSNEMIGAMNLAGAMGVIHRYFKPGREDEYFENLRKLIYDTEGRCGIAISPSISIEKVAELSRLKPGMFFCMDVAHGNTDKNMAYCEVLKDWGVTNIISGNIVTLEAAENYMSIGVNYLRVGIGAGSRCTTRVVTGVGKPQASAVWDIYKEFGEDAHIISDGGCKNTGDVVKALACGAEFVMTGYLLAGSTECPVPVLNGMKRYSGMASTEALSQRKSEFFVEGETTYVPARESAVGIIGDIGEAIKKAMYYTGTYYYRDLANVTKIFVTPAGYMEGYSRP